MAHRLIGFRFADFEVSLPRRELRGRGGHLHLEPRVFDLLAYLLTHRGRLVSREELLAAVWRVRYVSEDSLSSAVAKLRRALGDRRKPRRFVRTAYGHGYRFVARVEEVTAESGPVAAPVRGEAWAAAPLASPGFEPAPFLAGSPTGLEPTRH